ncbi:hypothetical protein VmeM32_00029 [Vibrio phage vB_VmeM-32]|nr:hypothetical protein VmeM32_00029 [Vibrio phage vB_VmeM-32]
MTIKTKDDLKGMYVDCSNKEDLNAFLKLVDKFDLKTTNELYNRQLSDWIRNNDAVVYSGSKCGFLTRGSVEYMIKLGYTRFFASDVEKELNVLETERRPRYEKLSYNSLFDYMQHYMDGVLFYMEDTKPEPVYHQITNEREFIRNYEQKSLYIVTRYVPVYDKETTDKAVHAVNQFLDNSCGINGDCGKIKLTHDNWEYTYYIDDEHFLETCRVALRAVGEIE